MLVPEIYTWRDLRHGPAAAIERDRITVEHDGIPIYRGVRNRTGRKPRRIRSGAAGHCRAAA